MCIDMQVVSSKECSMKTSMHISTCSPFPWDMGALVALWCMAFALACTDENMMLLCI